MKTILVLIIFSLVTSNVAVAEELVTATASEAESFTEQAKEGEHSGIAQIKRSLLEARSPSVEQKAEFQNWRSEAEVDMKEKSFSVFKGLILCLGVFSIIVYFMKRMNRGHIGGSESRIKVIEKIQVASKTSLILVELDGKPMLMSLGNDRVSVLNSGNPPVNIAVNEQKAEKQLDKFSESLESVCEEDIHLSA